MEKIVIGLSGGVDSGVAAYLLKKQGYEVHAVTMKMWSEEGEAEPLYIRDARHVAEHLDIPIEIADFSWEFKEKIVDNFTEEYINARTPNPCIRCNRFMKWEALLSYAETIGAEKIATGHYAKIKRLENGRLTLMQSPTAKDQTYALCMLTQDQLRRTLMPLGDFESKEEVRKIALEAGLPVAEKKDSQDICFIPDKDYAALILRLRGSNICSEGSFVDKEGRELGRHKGLVHYTIGQRKGLNLAMGRPVYVTGLDAENNRVIIGEDSDVLGSTIKLENLNFMGLSEDTEEFEALAKIRYAHKGALCRAKVNADGTAQIEFNEPQRAITPGQSVVFYRDTPEGRIVLAAGNILC